MINDISHNAGFPINLLSQCEILKTQFEIKFPGAKIIAEIMYTVRVYFFYSEQFIKRKLICWPVD